VINAPGTITIIFGLILVDRIIDYIEDADIIFGHNKNKGKTN
jgi:hypothetical protein